MTPFEAASYWFVRHDVGDMGTEETRDFESWLAASDEHRRTYSQVNETWTGFEDSADDNELRALRAAALAIEPAPKPWRRMVGIAAVFLLGAGCASILWLVGARPYPTVLSDRPVTNIQYMTAHNQPTTITLEDGSRVTLNLDTVVESHMSDRERHLTLTRGQAFFEVAKDPHRPFTVSAADQRIEALGTQFDVRLDSSRVEVVLLEGRVSVNPVDHSLLDTVVHPPTHVDLTPGQRLVAKAGTVPVVTSTDAARATSWREGWIVFEDEALGQVMGELNRYSDKPIITTDETVRQLHLSGVFRLGEPDRFGAVIQELLPVTARPGPNGETVLSRRESAANTPP